MLHLQPGVHLEEVKVLLRVDQELEGSHQVMANDFKANLGLDLGVTGYSYATIM